MTNYRNLENGFTTDLGIERRPVAIAFRSAPPAGVRRFEGSVPSCSFWRLAAEGKDELYVVARRADLERLVAEAATIADANRKLAGYHPDRRATLTRIAS